MVMKKHLFQTYKVLGASISNDLFDLGYRKPVDLKGKTPEIMYQELISLRGGE